MWRYVCMVVIDDSKISLPSLVMFGFANTVLHFYTMSINHTEAFFCLHENVKQFKILILQWLLGTYLFLIWITLEPRENNPLEYDRAATGLLEAPFQQGQEIDNRLTGLEGSTLSLLHCVPCHMTRVRSRPWTTHPGFIINLKQKFCYTVPSFVRIMGWLY